MDLDLSKIKVEPLFDYFELADAESMLSRHHPLGFKKAIGHRMTYAASYRGEWLAILVFDKAIDFNKLRDREIGWSTGQVRERRKHIANNSRFLIAPGYAGTKNLSSKILSLVSARISNDWYRHNGVPLLALETYVDPDYNNNTGACYEAAGWKHLGLSSGYQSFAGERTHSKFYFLKPLHKDSFAALSSEIPHALLTGVKRVDGKSNNNYVLDASKIKLSELKKDLEGIKDPRSRRGQYRFIPFLSLCISAVVSGHTQYRQIADWIGKIPPLERVKIGMPGDSVPHERTVGRFLSAIDPKELDRVLTNWLLRTYGKKCKSNVISLDGKAIRGTGATPSEQQAYLNVFANELGIVIHHIPTEKGGGEKIAAREFLDKYEDLEGRIILADAIHTDGPMIEKLQKKTPRMSLLSKTITNL